MPQSLAPKAPLSEVDGEKHSLGKGGDTGLKLRPAGPERRQIIAWVDVSALSAQIEL